MGLIDESEYYNGVKLPDFLSNCDGRVITAYIGGADVTEEWENWIKENNPETDGGGE